MAQLGSRQNPFLGQFYDMRTPEQIANENRLFKSINNQTGTKSNPFLGGIPDAWYDTKNTGTGTTTKETQDYLTGTSAIGDNISTSTNGTNGANGGENNMAKQTNPFADWENSSYLDQDTEQSRRAAYFSSPFGKAFAGRSPSAQRYFESSFADIYNEYLGRLGEQVGRGETPEKWTTYLQSDPFTARYSALPPSARGEYISSFAPSTRRLFYG